MNDIYRKKWKISSDNISKVIIFAFGMLSVAQTGKMSVDSKVMNNMSVNSKVMNNKGCGRNHPFSYVR
jgi:hypothetical protein